MAGSLKKTRRRTRAMTAAAEDEEQVEEEPKLAHSDGDEKEEDEEDVQQEDGDEESNEVDEDDEELDISAEDDDDELLEAAGDGVNALKALGKKGEREEGPFFASTLLQLVTKTDAADAESVDAEAKPKARKKQVTVLSKRKTREMKEIDKQLREGKKQKRASEEKKRTKEKGMVRPELSDVLLERNLRKIATRGVVMLFNTIQTHQSGPSVAKPKQQSAASGGAAAEKEVKQASKAAFLDLLKTGGKSSKKSSKRAQEVELEEDQDQDQDQDEEAAADKRPGWLRDDYLLGAKLADFGKIDGAAEEEEEAMRNEEGMEVESDSE